MPKEFLPLPKDTNADPLGKMDKWRLFQSKVQRDKGGVLKEVGFKAPDGKYYGLETGEELNLIKTPDGKSREPFIKLPDGNQVSFEDWKNKNKSQEKKYHPLAEKLDRTRLNKITTEALKPRAYYGRGFELESADIEQIRYVIEMAEDTLKQWEKDPRWKEMQDIIRQQAAIGMLMSFEFPPKWLADGGKNAPIEATLDKNRNNMPQIRVPSDMYALFIWDGIIKQLRSDTEKSLSAHQGTMAKFLGENLRSVSKFLKDSGTIPEKAE